MFSFILSGSQMMSVWSLQSDNYIFQLQFSVSFCIKPAIFSTKKELNVRDNDQLNPLSQALPERTNR